MSTKRLAVHFSLLAIIVASIIFALLWFKSLPTPESRLFAEREVYFVLLENQMNPNKIIQLDEFTLIEEYTSLGEMQECTSNCAQYVAESFPDIQQKTLSDFQQKNKQSYLLKDYFPSTSYISLIKNPAKNQNTYRSRLSFSRIGFNSFLTQALVLVGSCLGDGCFDSEGEFIYSIGQLILLQKVNGEWVIQDQAEPWITEKPSP